MAYLVYNSIDPETYVQPVLVKDYTFNRRVRNIVHESIDPNTGTPEVTLRVAGSRAGSFTYVCATKEDAVLLEEMHAASAMVLLAKDDFSAAQAYVVSGDVVVDEDLSANVWVVTVPYRSMVTPESGGIVQLP